VSNIYSGTKPKKTTTNMNTAIKTASTVPSPSGSASANYNALLAGVLTGLKKQKGR
jgi:hypothetical protein